VLGKDLAETIGATLGSIIMVISPQGELADWDGAQIPAVQGRRYFPFRFLQRQRLGFARLSDAQRLFSLPDSDIGHRVQDR
jgi:lipoprotein-releasing system permease protein